MGQPVLLFRLYNFGGVLSKSVQKLSRERGYTIVLYKIPMMFFRRTALAKNDAHSYSRNNREPSAQLHVNLH